MPDTQPVQADGSGTDPVRSDGISDTETHGKPDSESQGGAYPNPHEGEEGGRSTHGGQSEIGYHGTGQLGSLKTGKNDNAVTRDG